MATEKRLIYLEDAIALFEQDIEENKVALRTAYYGDKDAIRSEIVGMRTAISLVNSLARNGFTVDAEEMVHGRWEQVQRWATKAKYRCSVCGREIMSATKVNIEKYPYCHCGAKMDGDGNE